MTKLTLMTALTALLAHVEALAETPTPSVTNCNLRGAAVDLQTELAPDAPNPDAFTTIRDQLYSAQAQLQDPRYVTYYFDLQALVIEARALFPRPGKHETPAYFDALRARNTALRTASAPEVMTATAEAAAAHLLAGVFRQPEGTPAAQSALARLDGQLAFQPVPAPTPAFTALLEQARTHAAPQDAAVLA